MEQLIQTIANKAMSFEELQRQIETYKSKGATHIKFRWSRDRQFPYEWIDFYRIKSEDEIKQEKIKELENRINLLRK